MAGAMVVAVAVAMAVAVPIAMRAGTAVREVVEESAGAPMARRWGGGAGLPVGWPESSSSGIMEGGAGVLAEMLVEMLVDMTAGVHVGVLVVVLV